MLLLTLFQLTFVFGQIDNANVRAQIGSRFRKSVSEIGRNALHIGTILKDPYNFRTANHTYAGVLIPICQPESTAVELFDGVFRN